MSNTNYTETDSGESRLERVPPDERLGHERVDGDDPTIETRVQESDGTEWFVVGNDTGVVCTSNPVPIER